MTKRPVPSEEERRLLLRSLTEVGPSKPVGYLPLQTIKDFVQLSPELIAAAATARGLTTAEFSQQACCIKSGALYVYHREALASLLQVRAEAATAAGLPIDPDRFVAHIASVWVDLEHPAHAVIRAALADSSRRRRSG